MEDQHLCLIHVMVYAMHILIQWYYNRILHLNYKNNNGNCVRRTLTLKVMLSVLLITQTGSRTRQRNYEFNGVWVNRTDEAWRHLPLAWQWKNLIGSPGQRFGCAIYAEEAVANAMLERLSNALHSKTATVTMSLSQTILLNRCINQLFFNQEKVDTLTKLFSECRCGLRVTSPRKKNESQRESRRESCIYTGTSVISAVVECKHSFISSREGSPPLFVSRREIASLRVDWLIGPL